MNNRNHEGKCLIYFLQVFLAYVMIPLLLWDTPRGVFRIQSNIYDGAFLRK